MQTSKIKFLQNGSKRSMLIKWSMHQCDNCWQSDIIWIRLQLSVVDINCHTLTVAPSLMDMGLDFFPIWLLMLKPILEILQGAGGIWKASSWSSSSCARWWDVRLTAGPSPPTVLQETGLVFTLPSSSCGPAWGKTTHRGEQQFPMKPLRIKSCWHLYPWA